MTSSQLEKVQYQDEHDAGIYVGSVLPPNWQAAEGITITADIWAQSGNSFQVSFSLSQAVAAFGNGVYPVSSARISLNLDYVSEVVVVEPIPRGEK